MLIWKDIVYNILYLFAGCLSTKNIYSLPTVSIHSQNTLSQDHISPISLIEQFWFRFYGYLRNISIIIILLESRTSQLLYKLWWHLISIYIILNGTNVIKEVFISNYNNKKLFITLMVFLVISNFMIKDKYFLLLHWS